MDFKCQAQVFSWGQLHWSARRLYWFADYQGLTRGFRHGKIFCSSITARLVNLRIGVPWDRLQIIPRDETVLIDGVKVTFIDANHCPGSVMILFEPPNGKVRTYIILYCWTLYFVLRLIILRSTLQLLWHIEGILVCSIFNHVLLSHIH